MELRGTLEKVTWNPVEAESRWEVNLDERGREKMRGELTCGLEVLLEDRIRDTRRSRDSILASSCNVSLLHILQNRYSRRRSI